jgi:hypothetical protein
MHLCRRADILHPFVWNHASGLVRFHDSSDSHFVTETLGMIVHVFGEESVSRAWLFE